MAAAVIQTTATGKWTWWGLAWAVVAGISGALAGGRFDAWFDARKDEATAEENQRVTAEKQRAAIVAGREPALIDESPAGLLLAERGVVPFTGRGDELAYLLRWCRDRAGCPLLLLAGPGGVGKTRLALEVAEELRAEGWRCETTVLKNRETEQVRALHAAGGRALLVVDYAETRDGLGEMLTEVARLKSASNASLRVLLVTRQSGEWWDLLGADVPAVRALVEQAGQLELAAVLDEEQTDEEVVRRSVPCFAAALGTPVPQVAVRPNADGGRLPVLVLQAAALVAVLDSMDPATVSGVRAMADLGVLDRLLGHERRLWVESAKRAGLHASPTVLEQAVAVLALLGADDEGQARESLRRLADLRDANAERLGDFVRWLHALYPGQGQLWLEPLRPDLLAERHVTDQLAADMNLARSCLSNLETEKAIRALTVITRACAHHDEAPKVIDAALRAEPVNLAVAAISVAVQTGPLLGDLLARIFVNVPTSWQDVQAISVVIPHPTIALATAFVELTSRACALLPADADPLDQARCNGRLSLALAQVGRSGEALPAIAKAINIYRELTETSPDASWIELARSLTNQSGYLLELGRREDALTANTEAVQIYRELTDAHPDTFLPELAGSLNNQTVRLASLRRYEDALAAITEAIRIYRELADAHSDAILPDLAKALNNQAACLGDVGRREDALAASAEAVHLYQRLADAHPDAFLPELAKSLNNQAGCFADLGRRDDALTAITEAVHLYQQLADARLDAFLPDLAGSLSNRSNHLANLGRREDALIASAEAVRIHRELAAAHPDTFLPRLAGSLNNQSNHLANLGRREDALIASAEAVRIHRGLTAAHPDTFQPDLANSLCNQSNHLADLGRREDALAAITEAVDIHQELAETRTDAFLPNLANSLNSQSSRLGDLGQHDVALSAITEAVRIRRELAKAHPDASLPDLAMSLNNQSIHLAALGQPESALTAIVESERILRELTKHRPTVFLPDLAGSLSNLSNRLADLGRYEDALTSITEAVHTYQELTDAHSDAFLPLLANSLNNQSSHLAKLGRHENELSAITKAVRIRRELAKAHPDAFLPDLAMSVNNRAACLADLGRREDALTAITEALTIRRALADVRPGVFLRDLVQSVLLNGRILMDHSQPGDAVPHLVEGLTISASGQLPDLYDASARLLREAFIQDPSAVGTRWTQLTRTSLPTWLAQG